MSNASGDHFHPSRRTSQLYGWFIYFTLPEQHVDILGCHLKEKKYYRARVDKVTLNCLVDATFASV